MAIPVPHHKPGDGKGKKVVHETAKGGIKGKPPAKAARKVAPRSPRVKKA
jgi:hypothetical protein